MSDWRDNAVLVEDAPPPPVEDRFVEEKRADSTEDVPSWRQFAEPVLEEKSAAAEEGEQRSWTEWAVDKAKRDAQFQLRVARDTAVTAGKAAVGLPQAITGLGDMAPLTSPIPGAFLINKQMEDAGVPLYGWAGWMQEKMGIRYEDTQEILHGAFSPETQAAHQKVGEAEGVLGKVEAALRNPSMIFTTVGESIPQMLAGGVAGKALKALGVVKSLGTGAAIGEGLISAGSGAEQTRAESDSGLLTEKQVAIHAASGAVTALIGMVGAKAASHLKIADIDTLLAGGDRGDMRNVLLRVLAGVLIEGGVEEAPQSVQEQIASNLATGKPWHEGWDQSLVVGALSGAVMGGGANVLTPGVTEEEVAAITKKVEEGGTVSRKEGKLLNLMPEQMKSETTRTEAFKRRVQPKELPEAEEAPVRVPVTATPTEEPASETPPPSEAPVTEEVVDEKAVSEQEAVVGEPEGREGVKQPVRIPRRQTGQYVQWTLGGADQFSEPRKVTGVSPDGQYVFVEGATTGIPATETTLFSQEQITADALDAEYKQVSKEAKQERRAWGKQERRRVGKAGKVDIKRLGRMVNRALKVLGIKSKTDLDPETVKAKYLAAAKKAHPDAGGSDAQAKAVNQAWELLNSVPNVVKQAVMKPGVAAAQEQADVSMAEEEYLEPTPAPVAPQAPAEPSTAEEAPKTSKPPGTPPAATEGPREGTEADVGVPYESWTLDELVAERERRQMKVPGVKKVEVIAAQLRERDGLNRGIAEGRVKSDEPTTPTSEAAQPVSEAPAEAPAETPELMLAAGETATTATGRTTTPFPRVDTSTKRKAANTVKRAEAWLQTNALAEAEARGDEFNALQFQGETPGKMPQASKDGMHAYLFGDQAPDTPAKAPQPEAATETEAAQPEAGKAPKRRVGAKRKQPGRPINKQAIQDTFPGARITKAPGGWNVEIGDSFFTVQTTDAMPEIDWDAAEQAIGRRITEAEREQIQVAGSTSLTFPDGTTHDGLGLILLHEAIADDKVLRHEAIHLARQAGIIGQVEWDMLVKAHARGATDENVQEERIAQAMEEVETETRLMSRIQSWIRRMLASFGITDYQTRDIHDLLRTSGFWARAGFPLRDGTRYSMAWHGSPHEFSKFATEKIGTGEGAQAYGWGLYFADNEQVARHYKESLAGRQATHLYKGKPTTELPGEYKSAAFRVAETAESATWDIAHEEIQREADDAMWRAEDKWEHISRLQQEGKLGKPVNPERWGNLTFTEQDWWSRKRDLQDAKRFSEWARGLKEQDFSVKKSKGAVYQVELAPEQDEYLLWDKPLNEQSEKVKKAIREQFPDGSGIDEAFLAKQGESTQQWWQAQKTYLEGVWNQTGEAFYKSQVGRFYELTETDIDAKSAPEWASKSLNKLGIRGIKYFDGSSRQRQEGDYNYVIFDEADVEITTRYALRGRPDLANPGTDAETRRMVDDVDEARNQRGLPENRADEDVEREADERIARDYEGERIKLFHAGRTGKQLSDVETNIAKKIINRERAEATQSGDPTRLVEAMLIIESYRNTGSEQGRAFRQRRDPIENPAERMARAVSEAILEPPQKQLEHRNKLRREGNHKAADRINEQWAKRFQELKDKLAVLGVDLDNLWEHGYSRKRAAAILATIQHAKLRGWAKVHETAYEYWRNSILSLPTTQAANVFGNAGHAGWHFTAERFTEALVNTVAQQPGSAQWGEFKHMLAGMLPGMSQGARNFLTAWNTEQPAFEAQIGREGQWRIEDPHTAIGGKPGRVIRMPQRLLLAVDDFAKTMFTHMEVGVNAYRMAKAEGLTGEEAANRMHELTLDVESPAWDSAYDSALALAFQQKGGDTLVKVKRSVLAARRDLRGIRYLIPFVTTPANIFATGLKKSPLGSLAIPHKMYQNYQDGQHVLKGVPADVAQQVLAWALILALLGNDEEDPWITGAEAASKYEKRQVSYRTTPAMSVKFGDTWYSYSRLEPFATVIGMTVDYVNAIRSGDTERQVDVPLASLRGQIGSKTFLSGVADIFDAAQEPSPSEGIARWGSNFSTSWVPNIVRGAGREASDYYENRRVWGTRREWFRRLGKRTLQKTELAAFQEYPIYDVWGRPATRSETGMGPSTDWIYRITIPSRIQEDRTFDADRLIMNYNLRNDTSERFPLAPTTYYRRDGKTHHMTDGQYAELARLSGETSRHALDPTPFKEPTLEAVEWINSAVSKSRGEVRDRLIERWSGKDVEVDPEAIGKEVVTSMQRSLAYRASELKPKKKAKVSREDHTEAVAKYERDQEKSLRTLQALGLSAGDAVKLLKRYWLDRYGHLTPSYETRVRALRKLYKD